MTTHSASASTWLSYGGGTVDWDGPSNALSASGDANLAHTIAQQTSSGRTNCVLRAKGFDFSAIPAADTILGLQVDVYGYAGSAAVYEAVLQLVNGSAVTTADRIGSNKARGSGSLWPTSNGLIASFGSGSDLWSASLTRAIVTSSNFGVDVGVGALGNQDCYLDRIVITVTHVSASTGTIAVTEISDSIAISSQSRATGSLAVTEASDVISSVGAARAAASLALIELADQFVASGSSLISASFTVTEMSDAITASGLLFQPVIPGRNATWFLTGSPGATLIEHGQPRATIVERGPAAAGF
jgi:hypothetical protein